MAGLIVKPINKTHNYFISSGGYIFKIENGKEVEQPTDYTKSKRLYVHINGKRFELIYLMLEYFIPSYNPDDRIKFTISSIRRIPIESIKIIPFKKRFSLAKEEEVLFFKFKCEIKANAANSRCEQKITAMEVFEAIRNSSFKCVYCGDNLNPNNWHLDHFYSLKMKGINEFKNITPSCRRCNIMKLDLDGFAFINQCIKIVSNNSLDKKDIPIKKEVKLKNSLNKYKVITKLVTEPPF